MKFVWAQNINKTVKLKKKFKVSLGRIEPNICGFISALSYH